jgi:glycogen phosphorylase
VFDHVVPMEAATQRERFEAVARTLRDVLTQRWIKTAATYDRKNPKQVYYLSMEFLIGRSLVNNILNLGVEEFVREDLKTDPRQDWKEVVETEPDAGLGNGGLGRLAACFIDSLATLQIPAIGYGLRYDYGIFRQDIVGGRQVEHPDPWLSRPDPWEVVRPGEAVTVPLATTFGSRHGEIVVTRGQPMNMLGIPYDRPVVGFGGNTINTLRLWKAGTASNFNFGEFSGGDFFGAVSDQILAESSSPGSAAAGTTGPRCRTRWRSS